MRVFWCMVFGVFATGTAIFIVFTLTSESETANCVLLWHAGVFQRLIEALGLGQILGERLALMLGVLLGIPIYGTLAYFILRRLQG